MDKQIFIICVVQVTLHLSIKWSHPINVRSKRFFKKRRNNLDCDKSWLINFQPNRQTCWAKWKLNKRCFQNTVEQISFQNEVTLRYTNFYWSFNPKLCLRYFCFLKRKCYFSPVNLETHYLDFWKKFEHFFGQILIRTMSRRKQSKPIRHLDDGTPALNGTVINYLFWLTKSYLFLNQWFGFNN
jgi:hypothetical protein